MAQAFTKQRHRRMFEKIIATWDNLTLTKVLLGIFASISGISLYTVWEQRNAVFITLTGSIFAMSSMAVGVGLMFVAGVCWLFVSALDRKTDLTHKAMGDRIADLQKQVDRQSTDMERMRNDFDRALRDEREECNARLKEIRDTFTQMLQRGT
jgi:outer membrane murein-binding lipoprotein Lpp